MNYTPTIKFTRTERIKTINTSNQTSSARTTRSYWNRSRLSLHEDGAVVKDWGGRLPVALVYPNSYYLGMSNLGIHAIYGLLSSQQNVVCERVFRENSRSTAPLSTESGRPLTDFAVIAFSVSYELDYFNIVQILKAGGIPLYAAERDERYPLVIAGGPCLTANPEPLAPFLDAVGIGEAEAILPAILPLLSESASVAREDLLKELAKVPGVYVPRIPQAPVARQWVRNLDDFPVHSIVLTPDTELGDMFLIEAERGCSGGCRFCLVHQTFRPVRFHLAESIITQARAGFQFRRHIGLVGPAVATHPHIEEILDGLLEMGAEIGVSSLRINTLTDKFLEKLARGKMQTITLAPEAGSPRLRKVINKDMTDEMILSAIVRSAEHGIKQIKLYFMLGLPSETDEDIEGIISLIKQAQEKLSSHGTRLTLNVAPFVPKANTHFQWMPMESVEVLERRLSLLKDRLPGAGVRLKSESPAWSEVQAVLSRGDAGVAGVLAGMPKFTLAQWRQTAAKHNLDVNFFAHHRWPTTQKLPWEVVASGTKTEKLQKDSQEAGC
ncbi:MAG: radical SAM protein [Dehalococcoidales bacterium]|nr:radical SAM protein [Dehalococcoidales bacterium]